MANFPVLSTNPDQGVQVEYEDSRLKSNFEAGYESTRQKFTRQRRTFTVAYQENYLNSTDRSLLHTFITTTVSGGAVSFSWTNPEDSVVYTLRFKELPKFKSEKTGGITYYTTTFIFQEM